MSEESNWIMFKDDNLERHDVAFLVGGVWWPVGRLEQAIKERDRYKKALEEIQRRPDNGLVDVVHMKEIAEQALKETGDE